MDLPQLSYLAKMLAVSILVFSSRDLSEKFHVAGANYILRNGICKTLEQREKANTILLIWNFTYYMNTIRTINNPLEKRIGDTVKVEKIILEDSLLSTFSL